MIKLFEISDQLKKHEELTASIKNQSLKVAENLRYNGVVLDKLKK